MFTKIKYFDNAATTRLDPDLLPIIQKYNTEMYFNPSALSCFSTEVSHDIETARDSIANLIGADSNEITFTSCGTESDNTAMFGCLKGYKGNIVTSMVEHSAVYNASNILKSKGVEVRYVDLLPDGRTNPISLQNLIDENTQYVCLMHVNNESGAINDIANLCKIAKSKNPKCLFISDGVQAFGKISVDVRQLGVDFYTASGHKINAPKGIGLLYTSSKRHLSPYIVGGGQEKGMRSGTENVTGIIALAKAALNSICTISNSKLHYVNLSNTICDIVSRTTTDFYRITAPEVCSPNILTLMFGNIKTEVLLHLVESQGFVFGTGSACSSKNKTGRIISALKIPSKFKEGMVRISFDKFSTTEDATDFAICLADSVNYLRKTMINTIK